MNTYKELTEEEKAINKAAIVYEQGVFELFEHRPVNDQVTRLRWVIRDMYKTHLEDKKTIENLKRQIK